MGRIKTQLVKRMTRKLIEDYPEEVTTDFNKNKEVVSQHLPEQSKKIRNTIAGYATRLAKSKLKESV